MYEARAAGERLRAAPTRAPQNSRYISLAVEKRYAQIKLRTRKKLKTLAGRSPRAAPVAREPGA